MEGERHGLRFTIPAASGPDGSAAGMLGAPSRIHGHRAVVTADSLSFCSQGKRLLSLLNYASFGFITKLNLKQLLRRWVQAFFFLFFFYVSSKRRQNDYWYGI